MVMISIVGVATFDKSGRGATSIPHWLLLALITLLARLPEKAVRAHSVLRLWGMTYRSPRRTGCPLHRRREEFVQEPVYVRSCGAGEGSLLLLLPTPVRGLYTQVIAQKA
jgi:hypothetical protein